LPPHTQVTRVVILRLVRASHYAGGTFAIKTTVENSDLPKPL